MTTSEDQLKRMERLLRELAQVKVGGEIYARSDTLNSLATEARAIVAEIDGNADLQEAEKIVSLDIYGEPDGKIVGSEETRWVEYAAKGIAKGRELAWNSAEPAIKEAHALVENGEHRMAYFKLCEAIGVARRG